MFRALLDQILLTWRLLRDPRVSLWAKVIPALGVLYVLSPLDFIPDFIFVFGQLDDLGILITAMRIFESVVPSYITEEHRAAIARRHKPLEVVESPGYRVLTPEEQRGEE
jgi:uncharacterized membrane protein YkvA (DUF1232 family)